MAVDVEPRPEASEALEEPRRGFGWRKLQGFGASAIFATFIVLMIRDGFEPFFLIFMVPLAVGFALLKLKGRVGVVVSGLIGLALLVMNAPFIPILLSQPAATADFVSMTIFVVSLLLIVGATVPAFRQGRGPDKGSARARNLAIAAVVVVVAGAAFSIYSSANFESAAALSGDIEVVGKDFEFDPKTIDAEAGQISIHMRNDDSSLHTFTIEELGVDVAVPPGKEVRATFTAPAGNYKFVCKPHAPDMAGELRVK